MFERFTDAARRAVVLAQEESGELGHDYIGTEHLLLGVLADRTGVAGRAAAALGIDAASVRVRVGEIVGHGGGRPSGHIPFTPEAKRSLEGSLRIANTLGDRFVGTEHLLLSLAGDRDGVAGLVLGEAAGGLVQARETVLAVRRELGPPSAAGELVDRSEAGLLRHAVLLARRNAVAGQLPFAALVVRERDILGLGVDTTIADHDPTAHAEVAAIRAACRRGRTRTLAGADLVASGEPCPLCRAAAAAAGITRLAYAAPVPPDLGRPGPAAAEAVLVPVEGADEPFAFYRAVRDRTQAG